MPTLALVRHGQSDWNLQNRFTGWTDVKITDLGKSEAKTAGQKLKENNYHFDIAFASVLSRTIATLNIILEEMDLMWIPVFKDWRLNERHYGALQGLNKAETAQKYGDEQVHIWRRSYNVKPPALEKDDPRNPAKDPRYADLDPETLPLVEDLKDTVDRVIPYFENQIAPLLKQNKNILISAHGNSLRALIKHLENISDDDIVNLELATGKPIVYELNDKLEVISKKEV